MHVAEIVLLFRGAERLMIVGSATLALYIGYRLFVAGVVNKQSGEFATKSFSFKLLNVGPGVFFGLFGTCVLVVMISTNATIRFSSDDGTENTDINISYYSGQNKTRIESVIEEISIIKPTLSSGRVSVRSLADTLTSYQKTLARVLLGDEIYSKCEFETEDSMHEDCTTYDRFIK